MQLDALIELAEILAADATAIGDHGSLEAWSFVFEHLADYLDTRARACALRVEGDYSGALHHERLAEIQHHDLELAVEPLLLDLDLDPGDVLEVPVELRDVAGYVADDATAGEEE